MTSRCRYFARDEHVREREKIMKKIKKISKSIRKKHYALKIDRIEEDIALNRHFKLFIKLL